MRTINAQKNPFNHYLEEVEKKESAQRRRMIVLVMGLSVGFGVLGALLLSSFSTSQQETEYVPFEELNAQKVETLLAQQPTGFLTWDSLSDVGDSICSLKDYEELIRLQQGFQEEVILSLRSSGPPFSSTYTAKGKTITGNYDLCVDSIVCEVKGELKVDHPVYFYIANYDESNTYLMAYGEGSLKRIPSKHAFVFKNPGEYQIKITAFNPIQNTQIHTIRKVYIQPETPFLGPSSKQGRAHS